MKNSKGLSLLELIISLGVASLVTLAASQILLLQAKEMNSVDTNYAIQELSNEILSEIKDDEKCKQFFGLNGNRVQVSPRNMIGANNYSGLNFNTSGGLRGQLYRRLQNSNMTRNIELRGYKMDNFSEIDRNGSTVTYLASFNAILKNNSDDLESKIFLSNVLFNGDSGRLTSCSLNNQNLENTSLTPPLNVKRCQNVSLSPITKHSRPGIGRASSAVYSCSQHARALSGNNIILLSAACFSNRHSLIKNNWGKDKFDCHPADTSLNLNQIIDTSRTGVHFTCCEIEGLTR